MNKRRNKFIQFFYGVSYMLRMRYLWYFRRDYLEDSMKRRKGYCERSCKGLCCKINVPKCHYLRKEKCTLYKDQPFYCKLFPVDERDKYLGDVQEECTYYWED